MSRFDDDGQDLLKEHPVLFAAVIVAACIAVSAIGFLIWLCTQ